MTIEVGTNGKVISQGHHRWLAARLAKVELPIEILYYYDYLEAEMAVPFARQWSDVVWRKPEDD